jgi:hypothetical protein
MDRALPVFVAFWEEVFAGRHCCCSGPPEEGQRAKFRTSVAGFLQIDFKNQHGFTVECEEGRRLGFAGKQVIHPVQVSPAQVRQGWLQLFGVQEAARWSKEQPTGKEPMVGSNAWRV